MPNISQIQVDNTTYDIKDTTARANAEPNVIESISVNGTAQTIVNKNVDITVPTAVNADWDATSGVAEILHKPTLGTAAAKDSTNAVTANSTDLVESGAVKTAVDNTLISTSASGTSFALTDAADAPLAGLVIEGRTTSSGGTITNIGDNGLSVTACGKNLFDKNATDINNGYVDNVYLTSSGAEGTNDPTTYISEYIRINPNTYYTLHGNGLAYVSSLCIYDSNKNYVSGIAYQNRETITFNSNASGAYVRVTIVKLYADTAQLELGSTATAYESYKGSTAVLSTGLPLCSYESVKDKADFTAGVVHKRCEKIVLDGSEDENWGIWNTEILSDNSKSFQSSFTNHYSKEIGNLIVPNMVVSGQYIVSSRGEIWSSTGDKISINANVVFLRVSNISTVADLKTYLASNPVTVVYELAEPYEIPLSASELAAYHNLRTFENTTNITCTDNPQMILDYMLNTENGASIGQVAANFSGLMCSLMPYPNAGAHNAIYRGKYLDDHVTAAQWAAIKAGTFDDMYIGDYWVIGGRVWRIAAFDYYFNTGDTACINHHIVIVPDTTLYTYKMNDTDTTGSGYVGSKMYTTGLADALTIVETAFGTAHILQIRQALIYAVHSGRPYAGVWTSVKIWLMSETNVYGCKMLSSMPDGSTLSYNFDIDKAQYPLFAHDPSRISSNRQDYWLRDIINDTNFARVESSGVSSMLTASNTNGVRPTFAIYQS